MRLSLAHNKGAINKYIQFLISIGGVAILYVLAQLAQFGGNVIIARNISVTDFGIYSFIIQTAILVTSLAFLGLDQAIVRVVSKKRLKDFAWKYLSLRVIGISGLIIISATIVIGLIYSLDTVVFVTIGLSSLILIITLLTSSMIRADQKYYLGQITQNLWRYTLVIFVIVAFLFHRLSGESAIFLYLFSLIVNLFFVLILFVYGKQDQQSRIRLKPLYKEGLIFWFLMSSLAFTNSLDHLMLGKWSSFDAVGIYAALWTVVGAPFIVLASSFGYVALPLVVRGVGTNIKSQNYMIPIGIMLVICAIIWYAIIDFVVNSIYTGRYVSDQNLSAIFIITGIIRVIYVIPSVIIGGRGDIRMLIQFIIFALMGVIAHFIIGFILIPSVGVVGAAIGNIVNWTIRCGGGMLLVVVHRRSLLTPQAAATKFGSTSGTRGLSEINS